MKKGILFILVVLSLLLVSCEFNPPQGAIINENTCSGMGGRLANSCTSTEYSEKLVVASDGNCCVPLN